jgi:hypothetical protein
LLVVKTLHNLIRVAALAAALLAGSRPASAQTPSPFPRGDANGSIGWLAVNESASGTRTGNGWHHSFFGAAGAGWYWTEHLKTELDAGAGTESSIYNGEQVVINGRTAFVSTESRASRRTLGISQQYQFFRNAWFHPHVAAGADITWERRTVRTGPIFIYDAPGPGRLIEPERTDGPLTDISVVPFVATGFKAYMTRRAFYRTDLRVGFNGAASNTVVRFGFGVDF